MTRNPGFPTLLLLVLPFLAPGASLTFESIQDAHIADGPAATTNFGASSFELMVNWPCMGAGCAIQTSQGLVEFDISSLPARATIRSAVMRLYHTYNSGYGDAFSLYRNTSAWNYLDVTYAGRPITDPIAVSSLAILDNDTGVYRDFDVTDVVRAWHNGLPNFGLTLRQTNELPGSWVYFASSQAGSAPQLVIEYVVSTPEPASGALVVAGCLLLTALARSRRHSK